MALRSVCPSAAVLTALAVLTFAALAVHVAALPGIRGIDDFFNVELALGYRPLAWHADRKFQMLLLSLLRVGLWVSDDRPWDASSRSSPSPSPRSR